MVAVKMMQANVNQTDNDLSAGGQLARTFNRVAQKRNCGCSQDVLRAAQNGQQISLNRQASGNDAGAAGFNSSDPGGPNFASTCHSLVQRFSHDFSRLPVRTEPRAQNGSGDGLKGKASYPEVLEQELAEVYRREMHCPPVPDSATNTAKKGGAGTLGFTKIDSSSNLICAPEFTVDAVAGTCSFKARPINLSITSKFARVEAAAATGESMQLPNCGDKNVPIFTTITQDVSDLVKAGEQEHCDDLNLAFNRTLVPCHAALSKLESQTFKAKNDGECLTAIFKSLGFDPLDCTKEFVTMSADQRDGAGMHDFDPTLISKDCNRILIGNKKSTTNKIGDPAVAPAKLIPASTKCAPAPSAPPSGSQQPAPKQPAPPAPAPKTSEPGSNVPPSREELP